MDTQKFDQMFLSSAWTNAHLPKSVRAQVSARAYLAGAPSFIDVEYGDYVFVGHRIEGSETVIDLTKSDGTKLPPLVAGTSAGATLLGQTLEAK